MRFSPSAAPQQRGKLSTPARATAAQRRRSPAVSRAVFSRTSDFCFAFFPRVRSFNTISHDPPMHHLVHRVYNTAENAVKAPAVVRVSGFPGLHHAVTAMLVTGLPRLGSSANPKPRVCSVPWTPLETTAHIPVENALYRELLKPRLFRCSRTPVCFGVSISATTTTRQQKLQSERINM